MPGLNATMGSYETLIASGDLALITDQDLKVRLARLSASVDEESSLLTYFREFGLRNREVTRDAVLLIPNKDRTDTNLRVDFDSIKDDYRILLIVADQRRTHQIFGEVRTGLAQQFADVAARIDTVLGDATGAGAEAPE